MGAGAGAALGSLIDFGSNYILQNEAANRQYNNQLKLWNQTFKQQNARQDWLNQHSVEIQKNALRDAGLSAASLNGAPFTGDVSGGSTGSMTGDYAQMNLAQNILAAKQLDIQEKVADADIAVKEADAAQKRKDLEWTDRINQAKVDVDKANALFTKGQNDRAQELQKFAVAQASANVDLLNLQKSFQELTNNALDKYYDFNGQKVKGSEIPHFKELYALSLAEKTLQIDRYNAETQRRIADGDWRHLFTNEFGKPLIDYLKSIKVDGSSVLGAIGTVIAQILDALSKDPNSPIETDSKTDVE